jgi:predicted MFS family arabinose efflux permease
MALVISLRLFGLFLILPVFSVYARAMPDATPLMVGLALGVYGIGQMCLQVPLGLLSDRIGRKPAITLGLAVFAVGGMVAAMSHTLAGVALGRALQGMGAVAGAGTALAADLTADAHRGKVMGIIGISVGLSFLLALILGPPLEAVAGLGGLFGLTSLLALAAMAMLWWLVPTPARASRPAAAPLGQVTRMLADQRIMVLNGSVFFLHALLTATFVGLPILLTDTFHVPVARHWTLYLPVMLIAGLVMGSAMHRLRDSAAAGRMVVGCVLALGASMAGMAFTLSHEWLLGAAAAVFFSAFNLLEATLPTLVSRLAPPAMRGAAMGAYATSQFFGAFVGGAVGGFALGHLGLHGVFASAAALTLLWLPLALWGTRRIARAEALAAG